MGWVVVVLGGDPTPNYGDEIIVKDFHLTPEAFSAIRENMSTFFQMFNPFVANISADGSVPGLDCGTCGINLFHKYSLAELLTTTHIHSSMRVEGEGGQKIYFLCRNCAEVIVEIFEAQRTGRLNVNFKYLIQLLKLKKK